MVPAMPGGLLIVLLRAVILLGMLVAFSVSLGSSLVRDQRLGLSKVASAGRDPGLRVLLISRREVDRQIQTDLAHEKLTLDVLRPCWLVTPDQPDNKAYTLDVGPGEQVLVRPDADGLVFSSQTWGKEERWPVTRLRLQPRETGLPDESVKTPPGRLDPTRFEERHGQAVFALNGRRYRGTLEIAYKGPKQVSALNLLPIDAYVEGVIAIEMKASYPLEALKAQAIASRGYAYATAWRAMAGKKPYDLTDSMDDQEYRGAGLGGDFVVQAVKETAGQILVTPKLRQPFVPFFSASNGGATESADAIAPGAKDVSGREPVAAIMPVQPDPFCQRAAEALGCLGTHWEQTVEVRPEDIQARLQEWCKTRGDQRKIGYVTDLAIAAQDERSKRVQKVAISYTPLQRFEMTGHEFRMMIGPHLVRSTLWLKLESKRRTGDRVIKDWAITQRGWGHGVGMSQISAWAMAKDGYRHQRILQVFYPGAEIQSW